MNYKDLASAVIHQAVKDLNKPTSSTNSIQDRETARSFLCVENDLLDFWCAIAEVNPAAIIHESKKLVED